MRIIGSVMAGLIATVFALVAAFFVVLLVVVIWAGTPVNIVEHVASALIAGTLAAASAWLSRRLGRAAHIDRGTCVNCGYDLRGGIDRCPEGGKPIRGQT